MIRRLTHIIPIIVYGLLVGYIPASSLFAQTKIGYLDMEAVMIRMPETKAMQDELQYFQESLREKIKLTRHRFDLYLKNFPHMRGADSALLAKQEYELQALQAEVNQYLLDAEQQLIQKREELLAPILVKIHAAIRKVATEKGYTYVLNLNSAILSEGLINLAPFNPEHNLTSDVLRELGID